MNKAVIFFFTKPSSWTLIFVRFQCLFWLISPTLRKLRAEDMFETWVSDDPPRVHATNKFKSKLMSVVSMQEDDIDGIHIVAFAEEEDPGQRQVNVHQSMLRC